MIDAIDFLLTSYEFKLALTEFKLAFTMSPLLNAHRLAKWADKPKTPILKKKTTSVEG